LTSIDRSDGVFHLHMEEKNVLEQDSDGAEITFERFPDIRKANELSIEPGNIFEKSTDKLYGLTRLDKWDDRIAEAQGQAVGL
jgi:transposase